MKEIILLESRDGIEGIVLNETTPRYETTLKGVRSIVRYAIAHKDYTITTRDDTEDLNFLVEEITYQRRME